MLKIKPLNVWYVEQNINLKHSLVFFRWSLGTSMPFFRNTSKKSYFIVFSSDLISLTSSSVTPTFSISRGFIEMYRQISARITVANLSSPRSLFMVMSSLFCKTLRIRQCRHLSRNNYSKPRKHVLSNSTDSLKNFESIYRNGKFHKRFYRKFF